jgi:hypothetical protein
LYYRNRRQDFPRFTTLILAVLRFSAFMLTGIFLLSPMIKSKVTEVKKPTVIVAVDNSSSVVSTPDSSFYQSAFREQIDRLRKNISGDYNLAFYTFGNDITLNGKLSFDESSTDISGAVKKLKRLYRHKNPGAMILVTDGIYNKGQNPLYAVRNSGFPVYTVALGDTVIRRDIAVRRMAVNKVAFLGDVFPVEVEVVAKKCVGLTTEAVLLVDGKPAGKRQLSFESGFDQKVLKFKVKAAATGVRKISVVLKPVDNELNKTNNKAVAFVDVLDSRRKILITYRSPHPDIGAIARSLKTSGNYEVTEKLFDKVGDVSDYNLVILHNLPETRGDFQKLDRLFTGGRTPFVAVLGSKTNIRLFNSLKTGVSVISRTTVSNEATPVVNDDFGLFSVSGDFKLLMQEVPPLSVPYGKYNVSDFVSVPVYQRIGSVKTRFPLIAVFNTPVSAGAVIFGEGVWRWRLYDYSINKNTEAFDGFLGKIVKVVSLKVKKEKFNVDYRNVYLQDEDVEFGVSLYNAAFEPVTTPDVKILIKNRKTGIEYSYNFGKTGGAYHLNAGKFMPGDYSFTVSTSFAGNGYSKSGRFVVQAVNREQMMLEANHRLLFAMSKTTGGKMFPKDSIAAVYDEIQNRNDLVNVEYKYLRYSDVIDVWWLMLIVVILISAEWFIRKYSGGY